MMFLQQLPDVVRWLLLFAIGAIIGSLANFAIYRWSFYRPRTISPWSSDPDARRDRSWRDRIPVIGWWFLRRESSQRGRGFWIRPLLIEVATGVGLAWFFDWQVNGGLIGGRLNQIGAAHAAETPELASGWFLFHSLLLVMLLVATFIDFDDKTIPDQVTVPGTLIALGAVALWPGLRLPTVSSDLAGLRIEPLSWWSPAAPQQWHLTWMGLATGIAVVLVWCLALAPKTVTWRYGVLRGVRIMLASMVRRPRRTRGRIERVEERRTLPQARMLIVLAVLLSIGIAIAWLFGGAEWSALFSSLVGLAVGGGIVWGVRLVAGWAMGVEAMGFGDVTLMGMIGAFLGWQPALLVFVIAPFTSIAVALAQLLLSGENRLAFGPYLCLAAVIVLIGWNGIWNEWAAPGVFSLGIGFLLVVIGVCLVLMATMLAGWQRFKWRGEE